jgi:hypothetical protein
MTTSNTNNETTMKYSTLPTTDYLYARQSQSSLYPRKFIISNAHFVKVYMALPVSDFQHQRLMALCMEYNALTGDQQRAQNEAHLSAEDDFAIFTDEHGHTIIQHDPTYTTFKLLGFESVEMTTRRML